MLAGYTILTIVLTWPVLLNFQSEIPGVTNGGDRSGYVWDFWLHAREGLALWGSDVQDAVGAPFGRTSPASANVTLFMTLGPGWLVTSLAGPVVAYNVTVFAGLVLSASAMYLLIRWLGLGATAAAWSGGAFILIPYVTLRATSHLPFVHLEAFPLLVMAGVFWLQLPNLRRAALLALAVAFAWISNPYYGLMALIMAAVVIIIGGVLLVRRGEARRLGLRVAELAGTFGILVLLPLAALFASSRGAIESSFERQRIELDLFGARLTDYITPPVDDDFLSGIVGADTWARLGSPGGERTAFLGWTTIVLAAIGVYFLARRWDRLSQRVRLAAISAAALIPVLLIMSLAHPYELSWFGGVEVATPSSVVFDLAPYLRAYARFSIAVAAVVLVLAAIGFSHLIRGRTLTTAASIAAFVFVFSLVDLPPSSPDSLSTSSSAPVEVDGEDAADVPTWRWLADEAEPGSIVLETPAAPNEALERFYMFGQLVHGRRIVNGSLTDTFASAFAADFPDPTLVGAAPRLAALGVDYVTLSPWAYRFAGAEIPSVEDPAEGFASAARLEDGSAIWSVEARPADAVAVRKTGFWATERIENESLRWMGQEGEIAVVTREPGLYELSFDASGFFPARTYQLEVVGPDGTFERIQIDGKRARYSIELPLPAGESTIDLTVLTPAARQISPEDPRIVTVQMTPWDATLIAADDRSAAAG